MINIDKNGLKIIEYDFRKIANRLINCNYLNGATILNMFIQHIDNTEFLSEFVQSKISKTEDNHLWGVGTHYISMGVTEDEEIASTYQYLKFCVERSASYSDITFRYGNNVQESIHNFNHQIILPFVNSITGHITKILMQMSDDETRKYNIVMHGGQLNIAQDQSTIKAIQNNGFDLEKLKELIESVNKSTPENVSSQDKETITDSLSVIQEELEKDNPRKSMLRMAIQGLNEVRRNLLDALTFSASVLTLIEFVQPLLT